MKNIEELAKAVAQDFNKTVDEEGFYRNEKVLYVGQHRY